MKALRWISSLVLVCVFVSLAFTQSAPKSKSNFLKSKFDKSKNLTTVSLKRIDLSGSMTREVGNATEIPQLDLDAQFSYEGEQVKFAVREATLIFKTLYRYPTYQREQNLVVVLGDERALLLGATSYRSNSHTLGIEEILSINVPYEAMQKIAEAKSFRFILGSREIKLKEKDQEAVREFARAMNPSAEQLG